MRTHLSISQSWKEKENVCKNVDWWVGQTWWMKNTTTVAKDWKRSVSAVKRWHRSLLMWKGETNNCNKGLLMKKGRLSTLKSLSSTCPSFKVKDWEKFCQKVSSSDWNLYQCTKSPYWSLDIPYKTSWSKSLTENQNNLWLPLF